MKKPSSVHNKDAIQVNLSGHICSVYKNKSQQFDSLIPFFLDGLNNNEKCIYITHENTKEEVINEFRKTEIGIDKYLISKQFEMLTVDDTYMRNGKFKPEKMVELIGQYQANASQEGYDGLRGTGEMTWVLGELPSLQHLIDYEEKLNNAVLGPKTTLVCQYNENKFSPEILINIIRSHPYTIIYGKTYENKYFFSTPEVMEKNKDLLPADSYRTIIDIITEK